MMNIQLEKPVFYLNEFALRFELGPDDVDIWLDDNQKIIMKSILKLR
ncbi:Uncharacterised protein [Vibrio alginolyticus]|nr:Uncharacterised protein [Vibrio alginolyticus]